jgi:CRISPR system Cascade subunit CasC
VAKCIEIHIIQSLQASNPNRGEDGGVKEITFGGVRRARLSSQSQKRAARHFYHETGANRDQMAHRSRRHSNALAEFLKSWDNNGDRLLVARMALNLFNIKADKFLNALIEKDKNLLFLADHELILVAELIEQNKPTFDEWLDRAQEFIQLAVENANEKGEPVARKDYDRNITKAEIASMKKAITKQLSESIPGEIALFGRMMANLVETSVYGCVQVANALGLTELPRYKGSGAEGTYASGYIDFFSATDDIDPIQGNEESGAGMIGDIRFTAPTYYRYANVNVNEFCRLIGDNSSAIAEEMIGKFVEGFVKTLPTGYSRGFAHQTMPEFVLLQVKETSPYQYCNAFEEILTSPDAQGMGISRQAVIRLMDYRQQVTELYDDEPLLATVTALSTHYAGAVVSLKDAIAQSIKIALKQS